jgi:hypothetical protein
MRVPARTAAARAACGPTRAPGVPATSGTPQGSRGGSGVGDNGGSGWWLVDDEQPGGASLRAHLPGSRLSASATPCQPRNPMTSSAAAWGGRPPYASSAPPCKGTAPLSGKSACASPCPGGIPCPAGDPMPGAGAGAVRRAVCTSRVCLCRPGLSVQAGFVFAGPPAPAGTLCRPRGGRGRHDGQALRGEDTGRHPLQAPGAVAGGPLPAARRPLAVWHGPLELQARAPVPGGPNTRALTSGRAAPRDGPGRASCGSLGSFAGCAWSNPPSMLPAVLT